MDDLYQANILDHYRKPRNKQVLANFDIRHTGKNPSCGDDIILYIKFDSDGKVLRASFDGEGCAISQASASMLTEKMRGMTKEELKKISKDDIYNMLGVKVNVGREKCALLALNALQDGLEQIK